ncbi:MAG: AAA family ATPase [Akkermansiaceae bacterium]|nr:AAA family ATPase [Akkermansiaceae bacterium]
MKHSSRYGLGVVIGKFLPPHRGHRHLIERALSRCGRVVVIVCGKPSDPIPGELRADWLREVLPAAEVMLIDDRYDENDSRIWAENTIRWLGCAPDAVFTSEGYGDAYAGYLGCVHESVDPERVRFPCSGTAVRSDPFSMWSYIDAPVRAWYAKRIVIVGAESTGTTTLARALAKRFKTVWVPEFGREYSLEKQKRGQTEWNSDEFLMIAREQTRREEEAAREANRILICDTNAFATRLWHRRYMGFDLPELAEISSTCRVDLYLLTGDEIPFVQDGLRDGEHIRHEMHRWFEIDLGRQSAPWRLLAGDSAFRISQACGVIEEVLGPMSLRF